MGGGRKIVAPATWQVCSSSIIQKHQSGHYSGTVLLLLLEAVNPLVIKIAKSARVRIVTSLIDQRGTYTDCLSLHTIDLP